MKLHSLKNTVPRRPRKRVGRGNGNNWGRTCGRGEKGQLSRSGYSHRPYFEGGQIPLLRRLPKKGFNQATHKLYSLVNTGALSKAFADGDTVELDSLRAKGLVGKRVSVGIKILARGDLDKKLVVKAQAFSEAAKGKIEAAGGSWETV